MFTLHGYLPFEHKNTKKLYEKILKGKFTVDEAMLSSDAIDLIKRLLKTSAEKRIRLDEIKAHRWFRKRPLLEYSGILHGMHKIPVSVRSSLIPSLRSISR